MTDTSKRCENQDLALSTTESSDAQTSKGSKVCFFFFKTNHGFLAYVSIELYQVLSGPCVNQVDCALCFMGFASR